MKFTLPPWGYPDGRKNGFLAGQHRQSQHGSRSLPAQRRGIELGEVQDGHIQCPFHGFEFDASGKCNLIPANGRNGVITGAVRLNAYPTHEAHGFIRLWWGDTTTQEQPAPEFFNNLDPM